MNVEQQIEELIGSGALDADAIADLRDNYLAPFKAGTLDADDQAYIAAFHARITGAPVAEFVEEAVSVEAVDGLKAELEAAIARAERAEARVAELEELLSKQASA